MSKIDIMDNNFQTIINDREQLLEDYTTKINDLLERRALENNQLTHQNVKELLGEATSDIKKDMKENILGEIRNEIKEALQRFNIANNDQRKRAFFANTDSFSFCQSGVTHH